MNARARRNPNAALQEIETSIRIDDTERAAMTRIITDFVQDEFVQRLRVECPLFNVLYEKIYFTGSYYDGLRVGDAREFDLNLVFNYPLKEKMVALEFDQNEPGFIKMRLNNDLPVKLTQTPEVERLFRRHFAEMADGRLYMHRDKVHRYTQGLVDRILPKLQNLPRFGIQRVSRSTSGPAINLKIATARYGILDVDLVPVFKFSTGMIQRGTTFFENLQISVQFFNPSDEFFLVPKKPRSFFNCTEPSNYLWRPDFHNYERRLLNDLGCIKPVIRLLKFYRDCNSPVRTLPSYSLKTVVMHMRRQDPNNRWLAGQQAQLFLQALKRLMQFLEGGEIPYLYDPRTDILCGMNPVEKRNIADFLRRQIRMLEEAMDTERCYEVWVAAFPNALEDQMANMRLQLG